MRFWPTSHLMNRDERGFEHSPVTSTDLSAHRPQRPLLSQNNDVLLFEPDQWPIVVTTECEPPGRVGIAHKRFTAPWFDLARRAPISGLAPADGGGSDKRRGGPPGQRDATAAPRWHRSLAPRGSGFETGNRSEG